MMINRLHVIKYSAAFTTVLAGAMHFILATRALSLNFDNETTFFAVSGIVQIFWAIPIVKLWGKVWYYLGIAGTSLLIVMWALTKIPNPTIMRLINQDVVSGLAGATVEFNIVIEASQIAFIILVSIIIIRFS